ncbi:MAG: hypothetical protein WBC73_02575 [Phormidesmis sp.]
MSSQTHLFDLEAKLYPLKLYPLKISKLLLSFLLAGTSSLDVAATAAVETEAAGAPHDGDTTFHRQEASASQSAPVALADSGPNVSGGPFFCDSTFYISIGPDDGSNQQLYDVDRSGEIYTFTPIGPPTNAGSIYPTTFDYNGLAYNPIDNYMYAYIYRSDASTGPFSPRNILKIGNDGVAESLGIPVGPPLGFNYFAGTILSDQTYVVGAGNRFASIDLSTNPPTVIHAEDTVAGLDINDIAVDPRVPVSILGSQVYAINESGNEADRLVVLDVTTFPPTIVREAPNPTGFNHNAGSQFVDAFGTLYYRSGTTSDIYEVDTDQNSPTYGVATKVTSAPPGFNHDGVSCLFVIAMKKRVLDTDNMPIENAPAGTVVRYTYEIASGNVNGLTDVTFEDDLRNVATGIPLNSTFIGDATVSNGSGSVVFSNDAQTLQINDLTLPPQSPATPNAETVLITADVLLNEDLSPDVYANQAFLTNLPFQYPPAVPSDDPRTIPNEDPTLLTVTEPVASDPNVRLVKRITAINPDLAEAQRFNSSYVDVGAPDDDDNAVNWPGPETAATIGGGMVESYLPGIVDADASGATARPGDRLEYTISFLSDGDAAAQDVRVCDRIPQYTRFLPDSYAGAIAAGPLSTQSNPLGIALSFSGSEVALTGADDGDAGYYFPANTEPSTLFPGINCGGANDNGAVVVNLGNLPPATAVGEQIDSFGNLRFQVEID